MNEIYLSNLEFDKIKKIIEDNCFTIEGKALAHNLFPFSDKEMVIKKLSETTEATNLIIRNGKFIISDYENLSFFKENNNNIQFFIKVIESNGTLSSKALLDIATIFKIAQELKEYFYKEYIDITDFPNIEIYFSKLYTNINITKKIFSSITTEENISDTASINLNNIRKKKSKIEQDIKNKLNSFIHSSTYSKYIQENLITIRNNRFVIPVKEEYRTKIKGFTHDISSSGSTVFIEPISIFEMNNELNDLKLEESVEIEKILHDLTSLLLHYCNELKEDITLIGKLDFIFAKANYSIELNAICPIISDTKYINLINAKHPLIDKSQVVPISIELGKDFDLLVITGPNTGGKTVTLKTVGLLCAMALSGLHIPAEEKSSIFVFDQIFADIGDNQSISESLSTFSSHMSNIINILNNSTENSLILLDELGSGTDPLEGANLAISILEEFKNRNCLTISTTHYQEIKKYALVKDRFMNASVEFDIENLKPTYKLLIGIPGKSNAFSISRKLGLDNKIIDRAISFIDYNDINIEDLLKEIYDNKVEIEKEKEITSKLLEEAKILKTEFEIKNKNLNLKEQEIILKAKDEAKQILLDAKDTANTIINNLSFSSAKEANKLRNNLNDSIKKLSNDKNNFTPKTSLLSKEDIKPNMNVFINSLNQEGIVISNVSKVGKVKVLVGSLKMNVKIEDLEKSKIKKDPTATVSNSISSKSKTVTSEINLIGLTVEEAIFKLDKYIDDCILANLQSARIIHGKGTGSLRKGIWNFLKSRKGVKSFRMGTFGEGEMGVTIVTFK